MKGGLGTCLHGHVMCQLRQGLPQDFESNFQENGVIDRTKLQFSECLKYSRKSLRGIGRLPHCLFIDVVKNVRKMIYFEVTYHLNIYTTTYQVTAN